jgi:hypothetical protein
MTDPKKIVKSNKETTNNHNTVIAPVIKEPQHKSKKAFMNQYNNAKYLAFPEKTYTQHILDVIFDPKLKVQKPQRLKVNEAPVKETKPGQKSQTLAETSKSPKKAATTTIAKTPKK